MVVLEDSEVKRTIFCCTNIARKYSFFDPRF